jgi:DNA ligase D-like protein (predicted 3'-phosphoesterase)
MSYQFFMSAKAAGEKSGKVTGEKASGEGAGGETRRPIFVVQKHHATNLHYDFRLELDGVLKSWAVPKEPPVDPGVKRLSIMVEDHDLSYADFEGEISEGSYGAGKVEIWDHGTFEIESRKENKIVFFLHGEKLKGRYTIVQFDKAGPKSWLLFKTIAEEKLRH